MSVLLLQTYMRLKNLFKSKRVQIFGLVLGVLGGLIYWEFVGCKSGSCPIKSVWYWTMLWGAVFGYLIGDMTNDIIQKRNRNKTVEK